MGGGRAGVGCISLTVARHLSLSALVLMVQTDEMLKHNHSLMMI